MGNSISTNVIYQRTKNNKTGMENFSRKAHDSIASFPTDPFLTQCYDEIHEPHSMFIIIRLENLSAAGKYHSATFKIERIVKDFSSQGLAQIDRQILNVLTQDSLEYRAMFPNGHATYIGVPRNSLVANLKILERNLQPIAPLSLTLDTVILLRTNLETAIQEQNQAKEILRNSSTLLNQSNTTLAQKYYGIIGLMMHEYQSDPSRILQFFDFNMIKAKRKVKEVIYTGFVKAGETKNIVNKKFTEKSELLLQNTGNVDLGFALVADAITPAIDTGVIVQPKQDKGFKGEKQVMVSDLGNLNYEFLNITNLYTSGDGFYSVTVLH